jgi:hypothetical protein
MFSLLGTPNVADSSWPEYDDLPYTKKSNFTATPQKVSFVHLYSLSLLFLSSAHHLGPFPPSPFYSFLSLLSCSDLVFAKNFSTTPSAMPGAGVLSEPGFDLLFRLSFNSN